MSNKFLCMNVHSCHLWLYLLLLIGLSCGQYSTTFTNTSAPNPYDWNAIASSSSGQHLVAAAYGGGIYTSSNYGYDWSISTDAGSGDWISVASSSSGQYLCAADANWGIIVSSDYGNYWNVTSAQQSTGWISIASDSTGQYLVAVFQYSGVYTSNDYGGTWSLVYYEDVPWNAVACSSNGQYIVAVEFNGQVYTSSNYGDDWVLTNAPDVAWTSVASDSTGQYLTATSSYYGGYIYVSNDYGMNWNLTNAPYAEWYWVSSDSSGQCLFGTSGIGDIFYSLDYGLNWAQADAPADLYWKYISSSSDCQYVSAVAMGDGIYTTFYAPTSFPSSTPSSEPSAVPTSPSSQPSSQPSCTPSSSPTSQPSVFPSFVPSGQPSVMPTSQPSRSPTGYPTLTSSSFDVSSTVLSTTDKSTFTFTGVGCGSSVFLSALIDVSYLDSNSNGFMNFTAGSGDSIIVVSERCAPASSCGSVSCAVNVDVSSAVTCEAGGSLQINANTVNAADATGALTLCSYEGNNHLQYAATYTISALPLPTAIPTLAPTAGSNTPIVFQASPNAPFYVVAMCALLLIALGVFLVRLRDKTPGSFAEASLVATCADLALIGYHNSSELFYIIVLFSEGLEALAITIIFTRVLSMLPAVYFLVLSVGPAKYSQHYGKLLNQQHLFKNAPIFSIVVVLMMFEQSMIRYFPWNASGFSKLSRGFPDQHLFKVCMISKTIQLSVTLVIQIVVITVADSDILHGGSSSVAVALLVMYLISSIIMFILSVLTNAIRIGASEGVDEATAGSVNPIVSVDGAGRGAELVQTLGFVESGDAGLKARVEYLEAREREMTRELQELKAMLAISKMS